MAVTLTKSPRWTWKGSIRSERKTGKPRAGGAARHAPDHVFQIAGNVVAQGKIVVSLDPDLIRRHGLPGQDQFRGDHSSHRRRYLHACPDREFARARIEHFAAPSDRRIRPSERGGQQSGDAENNLTRGAWFPLIASNRCGRPALQRIANGCSNCLVVMVCSSTRNRPAHPARRTRHMGRRCAAVPLR